MPPPPQQQMILYLEAVCDRHWAVYCYGSGVNSHKHSPSGYYTSEYDWVLTQWVDVIIMYGECIDYAVWDTQYHAILL